MQLWIAGTQTKKQDEFFIFGVYRTEEEARAAAEKHTYHQHAVPILYECKLGETTSKGLADCYEIPEPVDDP